MPRVDDSVCFGGEWGCPSSPLTFPWSPLQGWCCCLYMAEMGLCSPCTRHPAPPGSPSVTSVPTSSQSPHLVPITTVSQFLPHCLSPSSPPITSSRHYLSATLSLHYTSISPQWSITTSVHILFASSALHCPHHLIYPSSAPCCHHYLNPISPPSPQPHTAPVPTPSPPVHPPSPQPHTALALSAPSCHLNLPTQFIPISVPLPQLHHLSLITLSSSFTLITHNHLNTHPGLTTSPPILSPSPRPHIAPFSRPPHSASHSLTHSLHLPPPHPPASRRSAKAPANSQPRPPPSTIG